MILIQYHLAGEAASGQHQTGFYRLSWLDTLIHLGFRGKNLSGSLSEEGGAPGGISPIFYQDGRLGELQRRWM